MLTAIAATLLTLATASPASTTSPTASAFEPNGTTTLAAIMPPPGAWALMGLGGLALIRSRRGDR